jgi:tetratricopeptide (TPR) repeat protein
MSTQRARRAERQADETRVAANQARGQAEQLLGYLTDDFARELASFGRLEVVAELAKRQLDYFKALPPGLKNRDTSRNGALAMVQYARAMRALGKIPEARGAAANAVQILQNLRQDGDTSERTITALALGTMVQAIVLKNEGNPDSVPTATRAVAILKPVAEAPHASFAARRAYIEVLERLGFEQLRAFKPEEGLATLKLQMSHADALGARDLTHMDIAVDYAEAGAWQIEALTSLGRGDEARRVGADAGDVVDKVLEVRPGYLQALRAKNLISSNLGSLAIDEMRDAEAIDSLNRGEAASRTLAKLNPDDTIVISNLAVDLVVHSDASWLAGRPRESVQYYDASMNFQRQTEHAGAEFVLGTIFASAGLAIRQADIGDFQAARATLSTAMQQAQALHHSEAAGSALVVFGDCLHHSGEAGVALLNGDPGATRRLGGECLGHANAVMPRGSAQEYFRNASIFYTGDQVGQAEFMLGDYRAAERVLRKALAARTEWPMRNNRDRREQAEVLTWLAMAIARQGRNAESQNVIAPVVAMHRELAVRNHDDAWQRVELAAALFAEALADKPRRAQLLKEASALMARVPAEMSALHSVRLWRERIDEELHARSAATHGSANWDAG